MKWNSFAYKKSIETCTVNVTDVTEVFMVCWLFVQEEKVGDMSLDMQTKQKKTVKKGMIPS